MRGLMDDGICAPAGWYNIAMTISYWWTVIPFLPAVYPLKPLNAVLYDGPFSKCQKHAIFISNWLENTFLAQGRNFWGKGKAVISMTMELLKARRRWSWFVAGVFGITWCAYEWSNCLRLGVSSSEFARKVTLCSGLATEGKRSWVKDWSIIPEYPRGSSVKVPCGCMLNFQLGWP